MDTENKNTINHFWEYIDLHNKTNNSHYNFNRFVEAIERNDNQGIEETKAYRLLVAMLSEDKRRFKEQIPVGTKLYRGRIVDIVNDIQKFSTNGVSLYGLNKYESKEPPLHTSKNGRSNIAGASYLYVAKDKYTAISECKPLRSSFVSVAEFQITKELKIFNLCDNDKTDELRGIEEQEYYLVTRLVELIMRAFYCSVYDIDTGYKVSQYVTELVRKFGYDGIAYRSFITNGKNYTIFNCCESNIEFINSEIVQISTQKIEVISMNDGSPITNPNELHGISEKQIEDFRQYIIEKIKSFESEN